MVFITDQAGYGSGKRTNTIALDYSITIEKLSLEDQVFLGAGASEPAAESTSKASRFAAHS